MDMGFPSGTKLKSQIAHDLQRPDDSPLGCMMLQTHPESRGKIQAFAHDLGECEEASIDEFLFHREEYREIGRLAVWLYILAAEKSALEPEKDVTQFWLYQFLDRFFEAIPHSKHLIRSKDEVFLHGLAIHTLNYDRLAEYAISTWINTRFPELDLHQNNFATSLNPDGSIVSHPHGALGPLFGADAVPFGSEPPMDPQILRKLASRLRFWFEPNNRPQAHDITNRMVELRGVHVVTGFGYHPEISNRFRLLMNADASVERVIATSSEDCRERAEKWLQKTYAHNGIELHHLEDGATCRTAAEALFSERKRTTQ